MGSLRKVFLFTGNSLHGVKEKGVQDRSSVIPFIFIGLRVRIYNGKIWKKKRITRWMIGFKFGEFSLTRRAALYKAKQKKKKKK